MPTRVFYATNRAPIGDTTMPPYHALDATPGGEGNLLTGIAEVTTAAEPEAKRVIERVLPDLLLPAPKGKAAKQDGKAPAVAPAIAAWAEAALEARRDAVLFIHGYANTWTDSICRAAQLQDFYATPRDGTALPFTTLAFGWPSDGLVMPPATHYPADRKDGAAAGPALAAVLAQVAAVAPDIRKAGLKVHLIVHSMGHWVLRHALAAYTPAKGAPALFDQALLAAGDEDHDALANGAKLKPLLRLAGRVTALVYDWDVILMVSRKLNGVDRLGLEWPVPLPATPGRDDAVLRVSPVIVELTDPNLTGHQYYRNNAEVRRDVIAVLLGKAQADIRGRQPDPEAPGHFVLWGATAGGTPVA